MRVYEGRATPRDDRTICGLCGELLYTAFQPQEQESLRSVSQARPRSR